MKQLSQQELEGVSGGYDTDVMDTIVVYGSRPSSGWDDYWYFDDYGYDDYDDYDGGGGGGGGSDSSADDTPAEDPVVDPEAVSNAMSTAVEATLEQLKKDGIEYVKIGDDIFPIDDALKALRGVGYAADAIELTQALVDGDVDAALEVVGDAIIAAGVGAIATALTGNPAIGVIAGSVAAEYIDSSSLIIGASTVIYNGVEMTRDAYQNVIDNIADELPSTYEEWYEGLTGQPYWGNMFDRHQIP